MTKDEILARVDRLTLQSKKNLSEQEKADIRIEIAQLEGALKRHPIAILAKVVTGLFWSAIIGGILYLISK